MGVHMISPRFQRGSRLRAELLNELSDFSRAKTPRLHGGQMISTNDGYLLKAPTSQAFKWVYALRVSGSVIVCREAFWTGTNWKAIESNAALSRARPAPGFTTAHFAKLLLTTPQPAAKDQVCRLWADGTVEPVWRFLLVDPPAAADCDVG